MHTATMTSKGQMTVPKPIRERLRIGAGDQVDFVINDRGEIVVRAATGDVKELKGLLRAGRARQTAVSVERMNAAILKAHARKR
jgi:AbrB family looped-hinge helix DNA binding protein